MRQKYIIYSMQRTGHHAVLFWLLNNFGGWTKSMETYIFWNDNTKLYYYNDCNHMPYHIVSDYNKLFMSYEDTFNHVKHGPQDVVIIILRDFLNMLASRYKKYGNKLAFNIYYLQDIDKIIDMWKTQAKASLSDAPNTVTILYNKWLTDNNYRNEICQKFSINNTNDKIDLVPEMGQGSSFCGMKLESDKDSYLKRFQQIELPHDIKVKIMQDKELIDLNKRIFDIDISNT
jgi:hypothetical protein